MGVLADWRRVCPDGPDGLVFLNAKAGMRTYERPHGLRDASSGGRLPLSDVPCPSTHGRFDDGDGRGFAPPRAKHVSSPW